MGPLAWRTVWCTYAGPGYSIRQAAPIPVPMHIETTPNDLKSVEKVFNFRGSVDSFDRSVQMQFRVFMEEVELHLHKVHNQALYCGWYR